MKIIESVEVVEYLKAGHVLVIIEDGTLVVLQEGKIRLQNPNWHSVVSYSDFKVEKSLPSFLNVDFKVL